ncbi:MAG: DNA-3-methyladenine glycosylase [bacterium]|nr:DNA-3-methyladenine glycosylase [bacterium]
MHVLPSSFFAKPTLRIARSLLGKYLVRRVDGTVLSGKISEVEAYIGQDDLACHASKGRTRRTEVMYGVPGTLYIYLVYGMYWCLNIVTQRKGYPAAVLIRTVIPVQGLPAMMKNRKKKGGDAPSLTNGPGKLCQAFGITGALNGKMLGRSTLTIEDRGENVPSSHVLALPRVGVDYAKHCAEYPWRFLLKSPISNT